MAHAFRSILLVATGLFYLMPHAMAAEAKPEEAAGWDKVRTVLQDTLSTDTAMAWADDILSQLKTGWNTTHTLLQEHLNTDTAREITSHLIPPMETGWATLQTLVQKNPEANIALVLLLMGYVVYARKKRRHAKKMPPAPLEKSGDTPPQQPVRRRRRRRRPDPTLSGEPSAHTAPTHPLSTDPTKTPVTTTMPHTPEGSNTEHASSAAPAQPFRPDASRLPAENPLVGRGSHLKALDTSLADPQVLIVSLVAPSGLGKTVLLNAWAQRFEPENAGKRTRFFWSFHGQEEEGEHGSSDLFFERALSFFGHHGALPETVDERAHLLGERLKELSNIPHTHTPEQRQPTLLLLDGVEPLQMENGHFADPGLNHLMGDLGRHASDGGWQNTLIVLTSRRAMAGLPALAGQGHRTITLGRLKEKESTQILQALGVKGRFADFRSLAKQLHGHPLALTLVGRMLSKYYEGHISHWHRIPGLSALSHTAPPAASKDGRPNTASPTPSKNDTANTAAASQNQKKPCAPVVAPHPMHPILAHYDTLLWAGSSHDTQAPPRHHPLFLRLLGLFDRPMEEGAFQRLTQEVTRAQPLQDMEPDAMHAMLLDLQEAGILQTEANQNGWLHREQGKRLWRVHPSIRAYFGQRLFHEDPEGWRQAHQVLARHWGEPLLKKTASKTLDTETVVPLHRAVRHACLAGQQAFALKELCQRHLHPGDAVSLSEEQQTERACHTLLPALHCFFPHGWHGAPWEEGLTATDRYWLVTRAAACLTASGRVAEAMGPQRQAMAMAVEGNLWQSAPTSAANLCELLLPGGALQEALTTAKQGHTWAEHNADPAWKVALQAMLATTLHQLGEMTQSLEAFKKAEETVALWHPETPQLMGLQGQRYGDLLLEQAQDPKDLSAILERTEAWFRQHQPGDALQDHAMHHLMRGRVWAAQGDADKAAGALDQSVTIIRHAGPSHRTAEILLHRALFLQQQDASDAARKDWDEAMGIAARGGLHLHEMDGRLLEGLMFLDADDTARATQALDRAEKGIATLHYERAKARLWMLRARLMHQHGRTEDANMWRERAEEQVSDKGQWGLLPQLEKETAGI